MADAAPAAQVRLQFKAKAPRSLRPSSHSRSHFPFSPQAGGEEPQPIEVDKTPANNIREVRDCGSRAKVSASDL